MKDESILIAFKLFLHDNVEHEKMLLMKINKHLNKEEALVDDILKSVKRLCDRYHIDFYKVIEYAREIDNDK